MPKYEVLQPIEHDGKLYLPADPQAPGVAPTAGHGGSMVVPVDSTGVIELTEAQAAPITGGALRLYKGVPDPLGAAGFRESKTIKEAEISAQKAAAEKALMTGYLTFLAGQAGKPAADGADPAGEAPDAPTIKKGKK